MPVRDGDTWHTRCCHCARAESRRTTARRGWPTRRAAARLLVRPHVWTRSWAHTGARRVGTRGRNIRARAGRTVKAHNPACSHQICDHTGAPKGRGHARWAHTEAGSGRAPSKADATPARGHAKASSTDHCPGPPLDRAQMYVAAAVAPPNRQPRVRTGPLALGGGADLFSGGRSRASAAGMARARTIAAHVRVTHSQVLQVSRS